MNKNHINWFKKIININSEEEEIIKQALVIFPRREGKKFIISFKINSFKNEKVFYYLDEIQKKLPNFIFEFTASNHNVSEIKPIILNWLNLSKEDNIDLIFIDKKFYLAFQDEKIYENYKTEENFQKLKSLGIVHSDFFKLVKRENPEIKIANKTTSSLYDRFSNFQLNLNKNIENNFTDLLDITKDNNNSEKKCTVRGEIFEITKDTFARNGITNYKLYITDYHSSIVLKAIFNNKSNPASNLTIDYLNSFHTGDWIKAEIKLSRDKFEHGDYVGYIEKIYPIEKPEEVKIIDKNETTRIELNFHTNMSAFDGINTPQQIIESLKERNSKAISINDFNSVQSFPALYHLAKKNNIELIYGTELLLADDEIEAVYNASNVKLNDLTRLIFFDLETTGLSPNYDSIIEFGAYITDIHQTNIATIQQFIHFDKPLDEKITKLTRITNDDLVNQPKIEEFLKKLHEVIKPSDILVAHNGIDFDIKFLNAWCRKCNLPEFKNPLIDTLILARAFLSDLGYYSLGRISRYFDLEYDETTAHRADADAVYLNNIFWKILYSSPSLYEMPLNEWNNLIRTPNLYKKTHFNRIALQCKFKEYKNISSIEKLYEIISIAHTTEFNGQPMIHSRTLNQYRDWFIMSCPAVDSDLFEYGLKEDDSTIIEWMKKFDYVQIAPLSAYKHLFKIYGKDIVKKNLQHLIQLAKINDITLVATSNAYYFQPYFEEIHKIYILTKSLGGKRHRFLDLKNDPLCLNNPVLHVRTTDEMLNEIHEIVNDKEYERKIVIENSHLIYDQIDHDQQPVVEGLYPPLIEGVEEKLVNEVYKNAKKQYGENLPEEITDRIKLELDIITKKGYSVVYWISHLLVKKSLDDGFLVGSRGSVGSSLVATFLNITEINPLPAHYYCPKCHYFVMEKNYLGSGYDLVQKLCTKCNEILKGEGQNIPFATFLGFEGDKIPDIDLNFSGLYQAKAHNFIREMFGKDKAFRAGTISTVAEKTAYAYVKEFLDETNMLEEYNNAQIRWFVLNCMNVKRTTGQHPGGIVIVPQQKRVFDFTPYNFPADDDSIDWYTTHFAFEDIHDNILKFDILGHDDPTILKYLKDLTNIDPRTIPTKDDKVISLFFSDKALEIKDKTVPFNEKNAAIGLPEFGTRFVREMLNETAPKTFSDLIRISGLSHGTDVWANNAQTLVKEGKKLTELVTCRDDIMTFLVSLKIEPLKAFKIMEDIRKGKGLKSEDEQLLIKNKIPEWYINSCKKIVYLFPKAHAAAYVLTAWRIAWFKVYYPLEYYATYFGIRCEVFDIECMADGAQAIYNRMKDIRNKMSDKKSNIEVSKKEKDLVLVLEVALEMCLRGYHFGKLDLKRSDSTQFIVDRETKTIIPPFRVLDGLGVAVATSIVNARTERAFVSIQDFKERTKTNKTILDKLINMGLFKELNDDNQLTFDF